MRLVIAPQLDQNAAMLVEIAEIRRALGNRLCEQGLGVYQVARQQSFSRAHRQLARGRRGTGRFLAQAQQGGFNKIPLPKDAEPEQQAEKNGEQNIANAVTFGLSEEGLRVIPLDPHALNASDRRRRDGRWRNRRGQAGGFKTGAIGANAAQPFVDDIDDVRLIG